ncbi:hypothetical protein B484DRAFT_200131 [Ochromonadaceae sp. CCMP2298]|nr:hypothetical protein B484DRAFT_200131 [Ochromonadaceae sp. CCMP2298]
MSGLTSLFSDSTKEKFARVYKAEEFQAPPKKVKVPVEGEAVDPVPIELDDGKKKRKPRKERKPESDDTAAASSSGEGDAPAEAGNTEVACTIFVGNVPVKETTKSITNFFKTYGEIDSVRLRSVPVAGAKVDEAGNQDLVRKVCVNAKKFGEQKGSFNAYIRFKEAAAAKAALAANNQIMGGRHLRVDGSTPSLFEPKRSIFVGGLPHYADEEEVREFFAAALPNGHEDIEGLRLIRDAATLVGKGIGYVLFKERESVLKGLALHKSMYKKRWALRISACGKRTKRTEQGKTEGRRQHRQAR